ncbi:DNA polymerase III subunit delta [Marinomonas gallaica]|uniref:DNA polymerase III subunit delta n=1 Tax=Marinomonas gallaica TaxID=1806667 RepID=UPI003CE4D15C
MKIRPDQLNQSLEKGLQPIYIVSGDEVLLCQEACDSVRLYATQHGIEERLRFVADAQFDWQDVINEMQALSLFSTRRLFDIQIDKMSEKHSKALAQVAQHMNLDNMVLLSLPKVDAKTQKTKWFSSLEQAGAFVQVWPIDASRLPTWVQQRAKSLNLQLDREAAAILCERGEGNLLALTQELEKLLLSHGPGAQLSQQTIAESVADSSRYSIYDLSDRLLTGKLKEALHCLNQLRAEGVEDSIMLWLFNRELTTLAQLGHLAQQKGLRAACQQLRIWDKRVPIYESANQRLALNSLAYMQRYIALLDQSIKGLDGPDIELGFRNLTLMFCGIKPVATELDV